MARRRSKRATATATYLRNRFYAFCVIWLALLLAITYSVASGLDAHIVAEHPDALRTLHAMLAMVGVHALVWIAGDVVKFGVRDLPRAFATQVLALAVAALIGAGGYLVVRIALHLILGIIAPAVYAAVVNAATLAFMVIVVPMILLGLSTRDVFDAWAIGETLFKSDDAR